jgi:hypothetical protein
MWLTVAAATAVVRRNQFEVEVGANPEIEEISADVQNAFTQVDDSPSPSAADVNELDELEAEPEEDSKLEMERWATHCGEGEFAEHACVKECMADKKCREQPEVLAAITAAGVLQTESIRDGMGFTAGTPCPSFYGDSALKMITSFGRSMTGGGTFCAAGDNDAAECVDGLCVLHNDDGECTGNYRKDPKKCNIRSKSCGTDEQCLMKCMDDKTCRLQLLRKGAANGVLNDALKVRCVQDGNLHEGGQKKCFFTPSNPCSDTCQDNYKCDQGRCRGVQDLTPQWIEPGGTAAAPLAQTRCKNFYESCRGEWMKPSDPKEHLGCSKCWRASSCCVRK